MIEILPNWHPIFVHFTVGLFSTAVGFYVLAYFSNFLRFIPDTVSTEFEIVARWCLWAVALITIATVLAGLYAYNTVRHDAPSHAAMTDHRNWALSTASAIYLLAIWSGWRYYKRQVLTLTFIIALLIVQGLLFATAWRGGELVYRHGLGVLSLPNTEGEQQQNPHHEGVENSQSQPHRPSIKNQEHHHAE